MSVTSMTGDLLKQQDVDAIINTVNCVGVMGKGIALQFKKKWPANFKAYAAACKAKEVQLGKMFIFDLGRLATPRYIINFPTKSHWRSASKLKDIQAGMEDLMAQMRALDIQSIAVPPLGCGNGGLDWRVVKPIIEEYFSRAPEVDVRLFEPSPDSAPIDLEDNTKPPKMTPGRAAILALLEVYQAFNYGLSRLEVQKLAYFLQESGEDLKLAFVKDQFGPYADNLRHALNRMDGHYIRGVGDGVVDSEITPDEVALKEAKSYLGESESEIRSRIAKVAELIEGYQSPFGMELLASVHWVAKKDGATDSEQALQAIQNWNPRKKQIMQPRHVSAAWNRLKSVGWI